jgi:HEAT repeat protein
MTLEGSLDDSHIRQILVDAVKGYSNPGIRRESLDALQEGSDRPSVRQALLYALENDPNPGLRLEAVKSVSRMEWGPEVQEALLRALAPRNNPGVRVAALNALVEHADPPMLPLFERLAATDPDRYVRLKSERAVRKLEGE